MKNTIFILTALSGICYINATETTAETNTNEAKVCLAPICNEAHPFLDQSLYPKWSKLTPAQALINVRKGLTEAKSKLQALAQLKPEEMNYQSVFLSMEKMAEELSQAKTYLSHLGYVLDSPEIRAAEEELMAETTEFYSSISSNPALWNIIKTAHTQPWLQECSPAQQRYAQQVYDSFKDNGAELSPEEQARKMEIQLAITKLRHQFGKNIIDSTNAWKHLITDEKELDGMTEDWKNRAAAAAKAKGYESGYLITLEAANIGSIMTDCHVEATRKLCWEAQCTIGTGGDFDNADVLDRVMKARHELATLLGFKNFADMTTAHRMVKNGDKALAFVNEITNKVKVAFDQECQEILDYAAQCQGKQAGEVTALQAWDRGYYSKQLAKERFSFDPESLKPYYECTAVEQGMFRIFEQLFNIRVVEVPSIYIEPSTPEQESAGKVEVWDPSVIVFAVHDATSNQHLGSFYSDLYARKSKRAGAWVAGIKAGQPGKNGLAHTPHLAAVCCNFPAPTAEQPSLLTQRNAKTMFHEFGHMLHNMLSDVEVRSHAGARVAWDFVEFPSQLFENWLWHPESIALLTKHYQTGEAIPSELVDKMIASRHFMPATNHMGQMTMAKMDLIMHTQYAEYFEGKDLDKTTNELLKDMRIATVQEAPSIMRSLRHCVTGGYGAGYYSYKWAEVLAADGFSRFKNEGIFNPQTGADFRKTVLSVGDSKPADEVYRDFMGRDPKPDALLEECGLIQKSNAQ